MPFTPDEFREKHNKKLTDKEAKIAADIANKLIASGRPEGEAIRTANAVILKNKKAAKNKKTNSKAPKGKR